MNICFLISSLKAGGAERIVTAMANYWCEKGYKLTIVTYSNKETDFYAIDPRIVRKRILTKNKSNFAFEAIVNNIFTIGRMMKVISGISPDLLISFNINVRAILVSKLIKIPVIISERTDPTKKPISNLWKWLERFLYPYAKAVVVQTQYQLEIMQSYISRGVVIPNFIKRPKITHIVKENVSGKYTLITVGRLSYEKQHYMLIKAFVEVAPSNPLWECVIIGDGPEKENLVKLVRELKLSDKITFSGQVKDVENELAKADIFALTSEFEGFPNVLVEAMAVGLPVITFEYLASVNEIVQDNVDGIVVPKNDVGLFAQELSTLMNDKKRRKQLSMNAQKNVMRFEMEKIMPLWERTITDVLNNVTN